MLEEMRKRGPDRAPCRRGGGNIRPDECRASASPLSGTYTFKVRVLEGVHDFLVVPGYTKRIVAVLGRFSRPRSL
ncbi:unnamed protein product [Lasius platythorax]|uniref:Uncharacterized protein n=1 Tax=Lasius platythorax TaxID=488582 RepID=A0AAV2NMZ9_9HYME